MTAIQSTMPWFDFKRCTRCKQSKPIYEFYLRQGLRKSQTHNFNQECKQCVIARVKIWSSDNPEKRKAIANKYARNNRDKLNEYRRHWRSIPENMEKEREYNRSLYAKNPQKYLDIARGWRKRNRKWLNQYKRTRAREVGDGYRKHKKTLFAQTGGECQICGNLFMYEELTVDHIIPVSKSHLYDGYIHSIANLQLACGPCNSSKGNKV